MNKYNCPHCGAKVDTNTLGDYCYCHSCQSDILKDDLGFREYDCPSREDDDFDRLNMEEAELGTNTQSE